MVHTVLNAKGICLVDFCYAFIKSLTEYMKYAYSNVFDFDSKSIKFF